MTKILNATEKMYAVLLTVDGEVTFVEKQEGKEMFDIARKNIGCEWIECVYCTDSKGNDVCMLIDEEGKLKEEKYINPIASMLYGTQRHGDPIVGNAMLVYEGDGELEYMDGNAAAYLAKELEDTRSEAYKIAKRIVSRF